MHCIASLRVHVVYCEPDVTARCDTSLHDAGIELESIQAFLNDATRHVTYIVNPPLKYVQCMFRALSYACTCMSRTILYQVRFYRYAKTIVLALIILFVSYTQKGFYVGFMSL